jgi:hypothetical protein
MSMLSSQKLWYSTKWSDEPYGKCGLTARCRRKLTAVGRTMTQPQAVTQKVLAGYVERVTYHNAENGFCVLRAKARGHRGDGDQTYRCPSISRHRAVALTSPGLR